MNKPTDGPRLRDPIPVPTDYSIDGPHKPKPGRWRFATRALGIVSLATFLTLVLKGIFK